MNVFGLIVLLVLLSETSFKMTSTLCQNGCCSPTCITRLKVAVNIADLIRLIENSSYPQSLLLVNWIGIMFSGSIHTGSKRTDIKDMIQKMVIFGVLFWEDHFIPLQDTQHIPGHLENQNLQRYQPLLMFPRIQWEKSNTKINGDIIIIMHINIIPVL